MRDLAVGEVLKECHDGDASRRAAESTEIGSGSMAVDTRRAFTGISRQEPEVRAEGAADNATNDEGRERTRRVTPQRRELTARLRRQQSERRQVRREG
jgi:hypothetical protein